MKIMLAHTAFTLIPEGWKFSSCMQRDVYLDPWNEGGVYNLFFKRSTDSF